MGAYKPHWQLAAPSLSLPPSLRRMSLVLETPELYRLVGARCTVLAAIPLQRHTEWLPCPELDMRRDRARLDALRRACANTMMRMCIPLEHASA